MLFLFLIFMNYRLFVDCLPTDMWLVPVGVWGGGLRPEAVDQRGASRAAPVGASRSLPRQHRNK
jgi:hypothetical protein